MRSHAGRPSRTATVAGSGAAATKAVAELVLLDNGFGTLPGVVAEGRRGGKEAYDEWMARAFEEVGDPLSQEAYRDACSPAMAWMGLERYLEREGRVG